MVFSSISKAEQHIQKESTPQTPPPSPLHVGPRTEGVGRVQVAILETQESTNQGRKRRRHVSRPLEGQGRQMITYRLSG